MLNKATFRAFREDCGLSQHDVAARFGVQVISVKRWERFGDPEPPVEVCEWIIRRREELYEIAEHMAERALAVLESTGETSIVIRYYRTQEELDEARAAKNQPPENLGFINAASRIAAAILESYDYIIDFAYPNEMHIIEEII